MDYGPDSVYRVPGFSTHSGTVGIEECFGAEFSCPDPIDMAFSPAVHRVKVWAGYTRSTAGKRVHLEAFNRFGRLVGSTSAVLRSPSSGAPVPVDVPLEVTAGSNSISQARVRFRNPDGSTADMYDLVVDDIEFEVGSRGLNVTPNPVDFGDVVIDGDTADRTATATASAQLTTTIKTAVVTGTHAEDFTIIANGCEGSSVPPGDSCTIDVRFDPSEPNDRSALLEVWSNAPDSPDVVRLVGRGIEPPPVTGTTTSSSSTTSSSTTTTATTARPGGSSTTVTTEPAPGEAGLAVTPTVGPPGLVVTAQGSGFPEGPVALAWEPGVGRASAVAGPDGTFEVRVLVLPNTVLGPRSLVATGGETSAAADFLAVPGTIKPSADNVTQITRARRYVHR